MDPQTTWDQLLTAYAAGDWDLIEERATDLLAWLDRGGFPPKVLPKSELGEDGNPHCREQQLGGNLDQHVDQHACSGKRAAQSE